MSVPIVFLDTETTGVHERRQVWEVGMIRRRPDGSESETSFFVDVDLFEADLFGLNVGRFYERHPLGRELADGVIAEMARSRAEAAKRIAVWTHKAHLVGAVPNFDTETLAPLLREHKLIPAWHYHIIDAETLAIGYLRGQGKVVPDLPWDSDALSELIGVEAASPEERHTALGDARWAMRIWDKVMGGAP